MKRTIQDILNQLQLTPQELADIINQAGGRSAHKPIIVAVECEEPLCRQPFFVHPQVYSLRKNTQSSQLCPKCKANEMRERAKLNMMKSRKKSTLT